MEPAQEAELISKVAETHAVVHEKIVPWLEEINGTVREVNIKQHVFEGALGVLRWIVITGIAVAGIVGGYIFTQADAPRPIQIEIVQPIQNEGR